jgi:uncharacterized protein YecT (DUF1311 family)
MAKRTTIDQILEWKERRGRSSFGGELLYKVDYLALTWEQIDSDRGVADFIPIRLATIIEVYVRETVREVVDTSQIYLDRAEPLLKNAKLDFLVAKHLHGQRITMGDIVAHSLSVTDLEHVISIYETLLPGYRSALPTVHERWIEDRDQHQRHPILEDVERVLASVKRIFEVRHIVTHEMPREQPYLRDEIPEFLKSSRDFLSVTDWFLTGELKGDVPRTQSTMNISAGESLEQETKAMKQLLAEIQLKGEADTELLRTSQDAWVYYANAEADLHASLVAGGSMHPMVWANHKTELTRARIKDLRWWLEREEFV